MTAPLRFDRNEAPIAPAHVARALAALDGKTLRTYPVERQPALRAALASRLAVPENNVTLANGADEILLGLCRALLLPGEGCVIAQPAFEMYDRAIALARGQVIRVPYRQCWEFDPRELVEAAANTPLMILASPNNPTGDSISEQTLRFLSSRLPSTTIAIDEVYRSFTRGSLLPVAMTLPNVLVIGSFSKNAGLAGMLVGYAVSAEPITAVLQNSIAPFPLARRRLSPRSRIPGQRGDAQL